jgi:hypothetical protein
MFLSGSTQKSEVARADTRKRRANIQNRTSKNTNVGHRMAYLRVVMRDREIRGEIMEFH